MSLCQPWVRPIVRGKAKAKCEFGAKIQLSVTEGFTRLERISYDAYNESEDFIDIIERWKKRNEHYPAKALADEIYRNKKNLIYCKEHGIEMLGKPLGRPKKGVVADKKRTRLNEIKRVEVERKISYAKGSYGLGLVKTKLQTTSKSVITLSIIAMNIAHAVRLIFVLIFKAVFYPIKNRINMIGLTKLLYDQKNNWLIGKITVVQ
ncbi:MAG: transposase [Candidatus Cloacimonetes bacterium]|nr:transposase [Candidatus Cloacimonadota bacterium]